jgi:hypothetical protein
MKSEFDEIKSFYEHQMVKSKKGKQDMVDAPAINLTTEQMLEQNAGYNPEKATDHGDYVLIEQGKVLLVNDRRYLRTDADTIADYIQTFPKRFGLILAGRFFAEELN